MAKYAAVLYTLIALLLIGLIVYIAVSVYKNGSLVKPDSLPYPITTYTNPYTIEHPTLGGADTRIPANYCTFSAVLNSVDLSKSKKQSIIENHKYDYPIHTDCDIDCNNLFIEQLYESFLVKSLLENRDITTSIIDIFSRIFKRFETLVSPDRFNKLFTDWFNGAQPVFPVNQRNRDWSGGDAYDQIRGINIYLFKDIVGVDEDPTTVLLSAGFLKHLNTELSPEFAKQRDYVYSSVLSRLKGYKAAGKGRTAIETQIGIVDFDFDELILDPRYYKPDPWIHPGRSRCEANPLQGMYQHEVVKKFIPLECGISGSTNFWIWTALFSKVNMTLDETRLFILSAFMVLNADGGHSLQEVLSSVTLAAIYLKGYMKYASDKSALEDYITGSNFVDNIYTITKDINLLGNDPTIRIDKSVIADLIYNFNPSDPYFPPGKENPDISPDPKDRELEIIRRQQLEAFFSDGREHLPFGNYGTFLNQISSITTIRKDTIDVLIDYVGKYC